MAHAGEQDLKWTFFFICEIFLPFKKKKKRKMHTLKLTFVYPKHPALTLSTEKKQPHTKLESIMDPSGPFC